jgi:hypothetical protein
MDADVSGQASPCENQTCTLWGCVPDYQSAVSSLNIPVVALAFNYYTVEGRC